MNKTIDHPLEEVFDIAPGSFSHPAVIEDDYEIVPTETVNQGYQDDAEDHDINGKIETIYDAALAAYENQTGLAEIVEPRYAARNAEVAAQYLSIALNTVSLKSRNKNDKRKVQQFIPYQNNNISNSNVVVADRNSIMQMIADKKKLKDESTS